MKNSIKNSLQEALGRKIIVLVIISMSLLMLNFVSADLGMVKSGDCYSIRVLSNCSKVNMTEVTIGINSFVINSQMQNLGGQTFNYSFCNTTNPGIYSYSWNDPCLDCSQGGCGNTFESTPTGSAFSSSQSFVFIGLLVILLLFLIGGVYGMARTNGAWTIAYICLGYLSLFCIFFVSWLYSTNYLWSTPIIASIFWILWLVMAFGFFPFILVISVYIIKRGVQDNLMKEYQSQGYTKDEALDMTKRHRR